MSCLQGRKSLLRAILLLFLSLQFPITTISKAKEENVTSLYFLPTVDFAVNTFNQKSPDKYAYRVEDILSSRQEAVDFPTVYSMKLQLHKTMCKKSEESLDTCPFQESYLLNNTFICLFTVSTFPWVTQFKLYKHECS